MINGTEQTCAPPSGPTRRSAMAKHSKPEHRRVTNMLGYALTLDSPIGWKAFSKLLVVRLTERERAGLALMALASLSEATATLVASKCVNPRAGMPCPPLLGHLDQAAWWADMASPTELDAYCLASFKEMSASRQRDFLNFVAEKVAA